MAKTVKQNKRKTMRRVKKGLAKASKRVVKNMNQLSMKVRKIVNRAKKMKFWGGMKYIPDEDRGDLIKIWDTFCKKRVDEDTQFETLKTPLDTTVKNYALFVIDMQNDFIDRDYQRSYTKGDISGETNMVDKFTLNGNFDVAQGKTMIDPLLTKLRAALNDQYCKYIIFSRDYHPINHASFFYINENINMSNDTYLGSKTGCFPAHCVQGHSGSKLIPELENFITTNTNSEKIKVIFKGIHPTVDSFTAVPMDTIDHIASNHNASLTNLCMECGEGKPSPCCSSVTGGFYVADKNAVDAMNYMEDVTVENSIQTTYEDNFINLSQVSKIEVCGLAGDYCVRDTIVALAKKYNDKEIVLLNYLTRYAFLPLFTIRTIPEHKAEYLQEFNQNYSAIDTNEIAMYKKQKIDDGDESIRFEKDIKYYIFDCPLNGAPNLMTPEQLNSIDDKDFIFWPGLSEEEQAATLPLTRKHFITGHKEILSDYENANKNNSKIRIQWMPNENN